MNANPRNGRTAAAVPAPFAPSITAISDAFNGPSTFSPSQHPWHGRIPSNQIYSQMNIIIPISIFRQGAQSFSDVREDMMRVASPYIAALEFMCQMLRYSVMLGTRGETGYERHITVVDPTTNAPVGSVPKLRLLMSLIVRKVKERDPNADDFKLADLPEHKLFAHENQLCIMMTLISQDPKLLIADLITAQVRENATKSSAEVRPFAAEDATRPIALDESLLSDIVQPDVGDGADGGESGRSGDYADEGPIDELTGDDESADAGGGGRRRRGRGGRGGQSSGRGKSTKNKVSRKTTATESSPLAFDSLYLQVWSRKKALSVLTDTVFGRTAVPTGVPGADNSLDAIPSCDVSTSGHRQRTLLCEKTAFDVRATLDHAIASESDVEAVVDIALSLDRVLKMIGGRIDPNASATNPQLNPDAYVQVNSRDGSPEFVVPCPELTWELDTTTISAATIAVMPFPWANDPLRLYASVIGSHYKIPIDTVLDGIGRRQITDEVLDYIQGVTGADGIVRYGQRNGSGRGGRAGSAQDALLHDPDVYRTINIIPPTTFSMRGRGRGGGRGGRGGGSGGGGDAQPARMPTNGRDAPTSAAAKRLLLVDMDGVCVMRSEVRGVGVYTQAAMDYVHLLTATLMRLNGVGGGDAPGASPPPTHTRAPAPRRVAAVSRTAVRTDGTSRILSGPMDELEEGESLLLSEEAESSDVDPTELMDDTPTPTPAHANAAVPATTSPGGLDEGAIEFARRINSERQSTVSELRSVALKEYAAIIDPNSRIQPVLKECANIIQNGLRLDIGMPMASSDMGPFSNIALVMTLIFKYLRLANNNVQLLLMMLARDTVQMSGVTGTLPAHPYITGVFAGGKCLRADTLVLLADGRSVRAGDLRPGDILVGDDGSARVVVGTSKGRAPMYRVKQQHLRCEGDEPFAKPVETGYSCNNNHLLVLGAGAEAERHTRTVPVDQLFDEQYKVDACGPKRPGAVVSLAPSAYQSIRRPVHRFPEEFDFQFRVDAHLPVGARRILDTEAALHLGRWLGNGSRLPSESALFQTIFGCWSSFNTAVFGAEKRIPDQLHAASRGVRLHLLAGLLEAAGTFDAEHASYVFRHYAEHMALCVAKLARSLGLGATVQRHTRADRPAVDCYCVRVFGDKLHDIPHKDREANARASRAASDTMEWRDSASHYPTEITYECAIGDYVGFQLAMFKDDLPNVAECIAVVKSAAGIANPHVFRELMTLMVKRGELILSTADGAPHTDGRFPGRFLLADFTVTHNTVLWVDLERISVRWHVEYIMGSSQKGILPIYGNPAEAPSGDGTLHGYDELPSFLTQPANKLNNADFDVQSAVSSMMTTARRPINYKTNRKVGDTIRTTRLVIEAAIGLGGSTNKPFGNNVPSARMLQVTLARAAPESTRNAIHFMMAQHASDISDGVVTRQLCTLDLLGVVMTNAMYIRAIPPPNDELLLIHMEAAIEFLQRIRPEIADQIRTIEISQTMANVAATWAAICCVYSSGYGDLRDNQDFFKIESIERVAAYNTISYEVAFFVIANAVYSAINPVNHKILRWLGENVGHYPFISMLKDAQHAQSRGARPRTSQQTDAELMSTTKKRRKAGSVEDDLVREDALFSSETDDMPDDEWLARFGDLVFETYQPPMLRLMDMTEDRSRNKTTSSHQPPLKRRARGDNSDVCNGDALPSTPEEYAQFEGPTVQFPIGNGQNISTSAKKNLDRIARHILAAKQTPEDIFQYRRELVGDEVFINPNYIFVRGNISHFARLFVQKHPESKLNLDNVTSELNSMVDGRKLVRAHLLPLIRMSDNPMRTVDVMTCYERYRMALMGDPRCVVDKVPIAIVGNWGVYLLIEALLDSPMNMVRRVLDHLCSAGTPTVKMVLPMARDIRHTQILRTYDAITVPGRVLRVSNPIHTSEAEAPFISPSLRAALALRRHQGKTIVWDEHSELRSISDYLFENGIAGEAEDYLCENVRKRMLQRSGGAVPDAASRVAEAVTEFDAHTKKQQRADEDNFAESHRSIPPAPTHKHRVGDKAIPRRHSRSAAAAAAAAPAGAAAHPLPQPQRSAQYQQRPPIVPVHGGGGNPTRNLPIRVPQRVATVSPLTSR